MLKLPNLHVTPQKPQKTLSITILKAKNFVSFPLNKNYIKIYRELELPLITRLQNFFHPRLADRESQQPVTTKTPQEIGHTYSTLELAELKKLAKRANTILLDNIHTFVANGKNYRATVPSPDYYHNIWNWDAAINAMGLVHLDPERAYDEARALVAGQWDTGMIPHVVYIPGETTYYPPADRWKIKQEYLGEIETTGITHPPLLAIAIKHIYKHSPDNERKKAFLKEMLPHLIKYHDYLKEFRDSEDGGLLTIVHPWESGRDNSPLWDEPIKRIDLDVIPEYVKFDVDHNRIDHKAGKSSHRPFTEQYYKYMYLIDLYANKWNWDYKKIVEESPFAVKDITMSSIWAKANDSLAFLLDEASKLENDAEEKIKLEEKATKYRGHANQTREALINTWGPDPKNPGLMQFREQDVSKLCRQEIANGLRADNWITEPTGGIFMPLYAGVFTDEIVSHLIDRLNDPDDFGTPYPVPSFSFKKKDKIDKTRYWRGPVWALINYFIVEGLLSASRSEKLSPEVRRRALEKGLYIDKSTPKMSEECGSQETYNPDGPKAEQGLGFKNFSFNESANIMCLNLLRENEEAFPKDFFQTLYSNN